MFLGSILIMQISQKTSIGDPSPDVVGMLFDEIHVTFADGGKTSHDSAIEFHGGNARSFGREIIVFGDPLIDLGLRIIIVFQQLLVFLFDRIIWIRDRH